MTEVPAHSAPEGFAVMLTVGVSTALTVIVMVFDVAVTGLAHVEFETITHEIKSVFARPAFTYVVALFPTIAPFSFH